MRNRLMREREAVGKLAIEGRAVIMLGISELYLLENPAFEADTSKRWSVPNDYVAHSIRYPNMLFVSALPLDTVRTLKAGGYRLYCLDWARGLVRRWDGYDPVEAGITPITL